MAEIGVAEAKRSVGDRIIRGGIVVGVASLLVRFSGLAYSWIFMHYFGERVLDDGGAFSDAHFYAFDIVMKIFNVVQQSVAPAFLPVFMAETDRDRKEAWRFASTVLAAIVVVTGVLATASVAFPGSWMLVSEWISGKPAPAAMQGLVKAQVPYMAPAFVGIGASVVTYMLLNARKRFFWAQSAEGVMRLVMIAAVGYAALTWGSPVGAARVIGLGAALGCAARVAVHLAAMGRERFAFGMPRISSPALRRFAWLVTPLLVGILFAQVRDFINHNAVLAHMQGLVTSNNLGRRIYSSMGNLVPWALGVAMFPYFCELVDRNDLKKLGDILTRSGRVLALVFFAFAGAVAVMSEPFMYAIFGSSGGMGAEGLRLAAIANSCYILVLPAYALEKLVMQGFFSNRKMLVPTVLGIVFSALSIGISLVGIRALGLTGGAALATVALGYTVARYLKTVSLVAALKRHVPLFPAGASAIFFAKALAVSAAAAGSAYLVRILYEARWPLEAGLEKGMSALVLRVGPEIAIAGVVSIAATLACIRLLRMEELGWIVEWFRKKRSGPGVPAASSKEGGDRGTES